MKFESDEKEDRGECVAFIDEEAYDAWFRGKVEEALNSTKPSKPHVEVMTEP